MTLTFAERFRLVFSLSGFANLSTKITTKREFRLSSAERKHLAIPKGGLKNEKCPKFEQAAITPKRYEMGCQLLLNH